MKTLLVKTVLARCRRDGVPQPHPIKTDRTLHHSLIGAIQLRVRCAIGMLLCLKIVSTQNDTEPATTTQPAMPTTLWLWLVVSSAVFVGWALFAQFAPSMGGVWLRMDSMNQWRFVPRNLAQLALKPFAVHTTTGRGFWTVPAMWPVNFPLMLLGVLAVVTVLRNAHVRKDG